MATYGWYYDDATRGEADTREQAEHALEVAVNAHRLYGVPEVHIGDLPTREAAGGEATYYYPSEEAADVDQDGAFAWSVTETGEACG